MTGHLWYEKHDPAGRGSTNSPNGTTAKTVRHRYRGGGPGRAPRDRNGSFEPQIVRKGQTGWRVQRAIIVLCARGMTTRDFRAYLSEMYDVDVSPDLISRDTDGVLEELAKLAVPAARPCLPGDLH